MATTNGIARGWLRRLAWFVGLWAAGVATVMLVGGLIRWWLVP
jgi:hypothetical protein